MDEQIRDTLEKALHYLDISGNGEKYAARIAAARAWLDAQPAQVWTPLPDGQHGPIVIRNDGAVVQAADTLDILIKFGDNHRICEREEA